MPAITSAAGVISLLDEPMPELQIFALKKLNIIVDEFWPEISEAIARIEILHEDSVFTERTLAALVASKVYYHLGAYEESMNYALGAGNLFHVDEKSEYVETIIAKCIDSYIEKRSDESMWDSIDPRQEEIVNKMFSRCFADGEFRQAMGIAIESRRMDVFKRTILESADSNSMLSYAFRVSMTLIQNRTYRGKLLRVLIQLYRGLKKPDYIQMCQCLIYLDDPLGVAQVLENLSKGTSDDVLIAYQIAFDMYESATQQFLNSVVQAVRQTAPIPIEEKNSSKDETTEEVKEDEDKSENFKSEKSEVVDLTDDLKERQKRVEKLSTILSGSRTIYLHLQFLIKNDNSDVLILKQTKDAVRVSICHTATVIANGFMHMGTTHDSFLRDNLDWLSRATNWAKLSATASLGVIHRGHERDALAQMQSYLPKDSANSSGYAEGGGLYALGLIHANHGVNITEYLLNQLKEGGNEQIRHGGCLGLGLAAMGTHQSDIYEQLKFNLYQDEAVTGEAAGLAIGLVEVGSGSASAIEDMVAYAQETQHEKILRGLAVGIALVMYGRLEEADPLIENLCRDKDAILRRSGILTISMAYCGTGSNQAIRRLLHVAVSDVDDDVRRAAVTGLGFLLIKNWQQCPGVVSLLAESYNPHVRYGAAMALGIACAGTGAKEAISLIEPLTNDPVTYVRQGALIASALVLIQHTDNKTKEFRAMYAKVIADKHEDVMAKFGAILAQGIIDAGGRNVSLSLQSRTGHTNMVAVVGMLVFTQYWYWFPLSHFLSLAFTPSCLIGLNSDLEMPVICFKSKAKPSTYGYPPMLEEKKKEYRELVAKAVLSITAKNKRKEVGHKKSKTVTVAASDVGESSSKMEVDEQPVANNATVNLKKSEENKEGTSKAREEDSETEPSFKNIDNPARVVRAQLNVMALENEKYKSIKDVTIGGIIMLNNLSGECCQVVEPVAIDRASVKEEKEADPPEPFEYIED